jgi:hypothetical protein
VIGFSQACVERSSQKKAEQVTDMQAAIDVAELKEAKRFFGKVNYAVPPPVDLYIALYDAETKFNNELLSSTELLSNYTTSSQKAINFGIYASDLAWCTVNSQTKDTYLYFSTAKVLAADLGFQSGYDILTIEKLEENFNNNDSLFFIIDDAYWSAFNHLVKENNRLYLSYIIFGGWLESVYIAVNSVEEYSTESELVQRIIDQVYLLENLIGFLNNEESSDETIKEILNNLYPLQDLFNEMYTDEGVNMDENLFKQIQAKINEIRNSYSQNS